MGGSYSGLELPVRDLFSLPGGVAWLNSAYLGARAIPVADAVAASVNRPVSEVEVSDFFTPGDRMRELFSSLVGGDADGVALVPSASYGVATAASALGTGRGDKVLMLDEQFPAMVYPWTERGAEPVFVKRPLDDDWTAAVLDRLDESVSVVSAPACHWTDGTRLDLTVVGRAAREAGARLVLDLSQSLGMAPFDARAIRPDFVVCVGYKWLLGPPGMSYLWASPENREGRPLDANWMARAGSEDFSRVNEYRWELASGARRYDAGQTWNLWLSEAACAGLEIVTGVGADRLQAHSRLLTDYLADEAATLGLAAPSPRFRSAHLMGLRLPEGADPRSLVAELADRSVFVSVRGSSVRVSAHMWNTRDDINRLLEGLAAWAG
ncbi:MAG: aminotransferase class V-fold PLP-dependent enzyme [Acidimicrobiia bacterium]|nr:aminotransferase class V-fold PLP-dependent enzyme [Acidimicrobiia bacterium]MYH05302.1 aminotransferase class V-fold PLP-dependent enzyme [Acidimicrobiia bacterium]